LQLAALSMRSIEDIPRFIEEFSGGYDYIADYLTGEVLDQQTEQVREFLLKTSVLDQFSAPLCEAITG
jgi:LuxR family maltose regulon positive regulatory protein